MPLVSPRARRCAPSLAVSMSTSTSAGLGEAARRRRSAPTRSAGRCASFWRAANFSLQALHVVRRATIIVVGRKDLLDGSHHRRQEVDVTSFTRHDGNHGCTGVLRTPRASFGNSIAVRSSAATELLIGLPVAQRGNRVRKAPVRGVRQGIGLGGLLCHRGGGRGSCGLRLSHGHGHKKRGGLMTSRRGRVRQTSQALSVSYPVSGASARQLCR